MTALAQVAMALGNLAPNGAPESDGARIAAIRADVLGQKTQGVRASAGLEGPVTRQSGYRFAWVRAAPRWLAMSAPSRRKEQSDAHDGGLSRGMETSGVVVRPGVAVAQWRCAGTPRALRNVAAISRVAASAPRG